VLGVAGSKLLVVGGEGLAAGNFAFGGALVLDGPAGGVVKGVGCAEGPVGFAEEFAGEEDDVGLSGADDLVGLGGVGDHADGSGGEGGFAADAVGEGDLVAGAEGDLLAGVVAAGGDVEEVDAFGLDQAGELYGLFEGKTAVNPIDGGVADPDGEVGGKGGADGADDFEGKSGAIGEAAAVFVGALVGERGEELVGEVAVGGVDFGEEETGGGGTMGGGGEVGEDLVHAGAVEGVGERIVGGEALGGGADDTGPTTVGGAGGVGGGPGWEGAGLAAGVGELDGGDAAVLLEEGGDAGEHGNVIVGVDAEVAGGDAAFRADGCGFRHDGAGTADGTAAEVDEMPVGGVAVHRAVLAHGGDDDAVGEGDAALLERRKKVVGRDGHAELDGRDGGFGAGLVVEDGFGGAGCGDGVGVPVDGFPVAMDELVDARDADVEFGGLLAGSYLGSIVFYLDNGDEVFVAVFCDEVDKEDFAIVIFGGGVGEGCVDLRRADGVGTEGLPRVMSSRSAKRSS
jgi:hypothetical protein